MQVIVTRIKRRHDNSACRAYVTVALPELGIEIAGVRIIERPDGSVYARLPDQRDQRGQWFPAVRFTDPAVADEIRRTALEVWGAQI